VSNVQQNTHWYQVGGRDSYTADPRQADQEEVARKGLHCCEEIGCEIRHSGDNLDYGLWLALRNQY
jgi:hypothetical protein